MRNRRNHTAVQRAVQGVPTSDAFRSRAAAALQIAENDAAAQENSAELLQILHI